MKTCTGCGLPEWPCFLVAGVCRMCAARHRAEERSLHSQRPDPSPEHRPAR